MKWLHDREWEAHYLFDKNKFVLIAWELGRFGVVLNQASSNGLFNKNNEYVKINKQKVPKLLIARDYFWFLSQCEKQKIIHGSYHACMDVRVEWVLRNLKGVSLSPIACITEIHRNTPIGYSCLLYLKDDIFLLNWIISF